MFRLDLAGSGDDPSAFDDIDEEPTDESHEPQTRVPNTQSHAADITPNIEGNVVPPELRHLSLPSTWSSTDNQYRAVELHFRLIQADRTIQALRESIADKSFQYSDVIRVAPRKSVRTRARAVIAKLNYVIGYQCRVYGRCRAAMAKVGADDPTLDRYQILLKEHVKSSTALLNPNQPGSTRVHLSWIWHSEVPGNKSSPERVRECVSLLMVFRTV